MQTDQDTYKDTSVSIKIRMSGDSLFLKCGLGRDRMRIRSEKETIPQSYAAQLKAPTHD